MQEKPESRTLPPIKESHEINRERVREMILKNIIRPDKRDDDALIIWGFVDHQKKHSQKIESKERFFKEAMELIKKHEYRKALAVYPDLILELIKKGQATLEERRESSFECTVDQEDPIAQTGKPQKYSVRIKLKEGAFEFLNKLAKEK